MHPQLIELKNILKKTLNLLEDESGYGTMMWNTFMAERTKELAIHLKKMGVPTAEVIKAE